MAGLSIRINQFVDYMHEIDRREAYSCFQEAFPYYFGSPSPLGRPDRAIKPSDFTDSTDESFKSSEFSKKNSLLRFLYNMKISMNDVVLYLSCTSEVKQEMSAYLHAKKMGYKILWMGMKNAYKRAPWFATIEAKLKKNEYCPLPGGYLLGAAINLFLTEQDFGDITLSVSIGPLECYAY